jgi:hypothetical protein
MGMNRNEFKKDINRGANFTDWRKDGKCIFYIHPGSDIEKRMSVSLQTVVENESGEEELRWTRRLYRGDDDPIALVRIWLEEDKEHDLDTVIFRAKTKGGDVVEYLKGDLLAHNDYDWRKRLLRVKIEYLYCIVNVTKKGEMPTGPEILTLPFSCAKKLNKVWDGEIEDLGEQEGDPWQSPYPCKVTFDNNETGSNMYDAQTVKAKVYPLNNDVRKLMDEDPVDMSSYVDPSQEDTSLGTTAQILKKLLVVSCPVLDVDVVEEEPEKPAKKRRGRPKGSKNKPKEAPEKPVKEASEDKPKPKAPSRPKPKPESDSSLVVVEDAELGVWYEYDDEPVRLLRKIEGGGGRAEDSDDDPVDIPPGEMLKKLDEQPEEGQDDQADPNVLYAKDCKKGETYYLRDGRKVKFKRYKESKDQAVFADENGKRVFVNEASNESVSYDAPEGDPLEPRAEKEETEQTKPKSKEEPEPEPEEESEEEKIMCPTCEDVPLAYDESENGWKCSKCKTVFVGDDDEQDDEAAF